MLEQDSWLIVSSVSSFSGKSWDSEHGQDVAIGGLDFVLLELESIVVANLLEALSCIAGSVLKNE